VGSLTLALGYFLDIESKNVQEDSYPEMSGILRNRLSEISFGG